MTAVVAGLVLVVAVLTLLVAGLLRSHAEILRRLHALEHGDGAGATSTPVDLRVRADLPGPPADRPGLPAVADLRGAGLADDAVSIAVDGAAHRTLLAFLTSGCATCRPFWEAFGRADLALPPDVRVVVVTRDPASESVAALRAIASPAVPVVMSSQAWGDYGVPGAPYFVLVDGVAGRVQGEGTGASWEQVRRLLSEATGDAALATTVAGRTLDLVADDASREARIDQALLAAGIHPGHPTLYEPPAGDPDSPDLPDVRPDVRGAAG